MEKNTIVLDELGNEIGRTYPKRAKGLVKNGRAEYVNDWTIRILHTPNPTVIDIEITEDNDMSNSINFNARDFRFDKSCSNNVGSRMFITDMFGDSLEVYEIGDGRDNVTQIQTIKNLEKNTDYVFRFAMTTSKDWLEGSIQFMIVPIAGEEETDEDWENRYVFNLSQNQYKSSVSKLWGLNIIRVYEIPFNSADANKFRFVFMNKNAVARIFPAKEVEAYGKFQDFSYAGWFNEKKEQFEKFGRDLDFEKTIKEASEATKKVAEDFAEKFKSFNFNFGDIVKDMASNSAPKNSNRRDENIDETELCNILKEMNDGSSLNLVNCNVMDILSDTDIEIVKRDGINVSISNSNIGGDSFGKMVQSVGDGSNLDISNSNVGGIGKSVSGSADGLRLSLKNSNIKASAFAAFMTLVGDGCNVDLQGTVIADDGTDFDYGDTVDGVYINAAFAIIPPSIKGKIRAKLGDGCEISGIN